MIGAAAGGTARGRRPAGRGLAVRRCAPWILLCLLVLTPSAPAAAEDATTKATRQALDKLADLGVPYDKKPWAWIAVLNGDADNERDAVLSLLRMELCYREPSTDRLSRAIVLIDRHKGFTKEWGDWSGARAYRVLIGANTLEVDSSLLKDVGEVSMCHPETLRRFIGAAIKKCPADHYALTIGTHGAGWGTFLADEDAPGSKDGKDRGDIFVLSDALRAALADVGRERIDVLSIESCIMGQIDVATAFEGLVDVLCFSEATSRGSDTSEHLMEEGIQAHPDDARAAVKKALQEVYEQRVGYGAASPKALTTRSALDLHKLPALRKALDALVERLLETADRDWPIYARAIVTAEAYVPPDDATRGKQARASYDLVDVIQRIRANVPAGRVEKEYQRFMRAFDACVIGNCTGTQRRHSHGLAIYAPFREGLVSPDYEDTPFAKKSAWPRLLAAIHALQKQHPVLPRIGDVRIVDAAGRPARVVNPLAGCRCLFTLAGTDILGLNFGIAVPRKLADVVLVNTGFAPSISPERRKGRTPDEIELLMPTFRNGTTALAQDLGGVIFQWAAPEAKEPVYVSVQTQANEARTITVKGLLRLPGEDEDRHVVVHFDRTTWKVVDVAHHRFDEKGNAIGVAHVEVKPDAVFTPQLDAITADRKHHDFAYRKARWGEDPRLILGLAPAGKLLLYLQTATIAGLPAVARIPFELGSDPLFAKYLQGTRRVAIKQLLGHWRLERVVPGGAGASPTVKDTGIRFEFRTVNEAWPNLFGVRTQAGKTRACNAHFEPEGLPTLSLLRPHPRLDYVREELLVTVPLNHAERPTFLARDIGMKGIFRLVPIAPPRQPAHDLVGTWVSGDGLTVHLTKGRYRLLEGGKETDKGSWSAKGTRMVIESDAGGVEVLQIELRDGLLHVKDEDGKVYTLRRKLRD